MPQAIDQLRQFYENFSNYSSERLKQLYHEDVTFVDPLHALQGVEALDKYFRAGMANVTECRFEFDHAVIDQQRAVLPWTMKYRHHALKAGELLALPGISIVEFDRQIITHRDYYDLGAMVYEHIPLLGSAVRAIKHKMQR